MIEIDPNKLNKQCIIDIISLSSIVRIAKYMTNKEIKKIIEKFYNDDQSKFILLNKLTKKTLLELSYKLNKDKIYYDNNYKNIINELTKNSIVRIINNLEKKDMNKSLVTLVYDDNIMKENILKNLSKETLINLISELHK